MSWKYRLRKDMKKGRGWGRFAVIVDLQQNIIKFRKYNESRAKRVKHIIKHVYS